MGISLPKVMGEAGFPCNDPKSRILPSHCWTMIINSSFTPQMAPISSLEKVVWKVVQNSPNVGVLEAARL